MWLDKYPTGRRKTWQIEIGELPPAKSPEGALIHLANLGYYTGAPAKELPESGKAALRWFQKDHDLDDTGELDDKTVQEIEKVHKS